MTDVKPLEVTYDLGFYAGDDEEITVFSPTVRFIAKGQPDLGLATEAWNRWGQPRRLLVTLVPIHD